jgi:hypothetical protein
MHNFPLNKTVKLNCYTNLIENKNEYLSFLIHNSKKEIIFKLTNSFNDKKTL